MARAISYCPLRCSNSRPERESSPEGEKKSWRLGSLRAAAISRSSSASSLRWATGWSAARVIFFGEDTRLFSLYYSRYLRLACLLSDALVDFVAEAEGEDGEEAQVVEVVLQVVLFGDDVGLVDWAALDFRGVGSGTSVSGEGISHRGRGEVLDADLGLEAEVALLGQHVAEADGGAWNNIVASEGEDSVASE